MAGRKMADKKMGGATEGIFYFSHSPVSRAIRRSCLFDIGASLFDLRQNILVRRALLVIDLDEFPSNLAFEVDYVSRGMRPSAFGHLVEQSVAINHVVVGV